MINELTKERYWLPKCEETSTNVPRRLASIRKIEIVANK